jgi:phosphoribosylanthranilate isomerase
MHVKICGITRLEDAEPAVSLGAWAIGFILWPRSPRYVEPGTAGGIARVMRRKVETVGVFVNQPLDEVVGLAEALQLSHVQLHGEEGPSFCTAVAQRTGAKVIKAARVAHASDLRDLDRFHTDYHLLDTKRAGSYGGTGETWDWSLLKSRRSKIPLILAGGLNPDNVADAIAATQPWGVDVSSGVESAPGIKDHDKLRALFAAVGDHSRAPVDRGIPEVLVYPPREDGDSRPGGDVAGRGSPRGLALPRRRGTRPS